MSVIQFKNLELAPVVNFLSGIALKGKASRGRTKLVMLLSAKHQELLDDVEQLKTEYSVGSKVSEEEQQSAKYQQQLDEYNEQFSELASEVVSVNFEEYQQFVDSLITGLYDCDVAFSGQDSLIYDKVLEQLEKLLEGADE